MTEPERPLHVRVAEALGITIMFDDSEGWTHFPGEFSDGRKPLPRYDEDWSATGPLIEKYRFCLYERGASGWVADPVTMDVSGEGPTILLAVCNLILALNKAGHLE